MRVIPVIDLKGGIAVHAVRGQRHLYEPLRGVLADSCDPLAVARAFKTRLGLDDLYVADLDAIEGGRAPHPSVASLAREARVILDAGAGDAAGARAVLGLGVDGVVVGSETLSEVDALGRIRLALPGIRVVVSLDLRAGRVLSRTPDLSDLTPAEALQRLITAGGVHDVLVLDLARVGTGAGPDAALIGDLHRRFPQLRLVAGGGVRHADDLRALRSQGAEGALVATALHTGAIGPDELRELTETA